MSIHSEARALGDEMVALRRALHREPEVGLNLPKTQQRVLNALDGLPLEIATGTALSSVTAVLRGARPGPTVLLRGDMDGLPVTERTGLDYASVTGDTMHACGHDLHTAMLVGAARLLCARRDTLAGSVVFMFQPGEEGWDGAGLMLDEGVLDAAGSPPAAAYGIHVFSSRLPLGMFAARRGPQMASADGLYVTVRGAGGHGSMPHTTRDPIPPLCEMVLALQTVVTREFDVFDPVVLSVGKITGGTIENVIPDDAGFEATVRTFSPQAREKMAEVTVRTCRGVAAAHGLDIDVRFREEYPVTVNDDTEADFAAATAAELYGTERYLELPAPITGSEDFSKMLARVPGAFVFLGAAPPGTDLDAAPSNHSPIAVFDDAVLPDGAALHAELAMRRMARDI